MSPFTFRVSNCRCNSLSVLVYLACQVFVVGVGFRNKLQVSSVSLTDFPIPQTTTVACSLSELSLLEWFGYFLK